MPADLEVVENAARSRFEVALGDEVAVAEYLIDGGRMVFTHTEVPPAFRGQGVAEKLVLAGLGAARGRGLQIIPQCSYVAAVLARHPEFQPDR